MARPVATNAFWIIGAVAVLDVQTRRHPRASVLIDAADLPIVLDGRGRWSCRQASPSSTQYAARASAGSSEVLHHKVLPPAPGLVTDHRNGSGLDNRRRNLRSATRAQNAHNGRPRKNGFKGVGIERSTGKWRAQICFQYRRQHLGLFDREIDAAKAYDRAARAQFGEFARLNFPE